MGESISKYRFAQATAKTGITFFNLREAGLMPHCASWVGFSQRPFAGWSLLLPPYQMTKKKELLLISITSLCVWKARGYPGSQ